MEIQSLEGYFEAIGDKTYTNHYPSQIIILDELRDKVIVEFGSGKGNDIKYLIEHVHLDPQNIFLIESDIYHFVDAMDALEPLFREHYNMTHFRVRSVLDSGLGDAFADIVYANNFFHCLSYPTVEESSIRFAYSFTCRFPFLHVPDQVRYEWEKTASLSPSAKISVALQEAWRILRPNGILFGRMLSDHIDTERLRTLESRFAMSESFDVSKKEAFVLQTVRALQEGTLCGLSPATFEQYARNAGFPSVYTEVRASPSKPIADFYFRCEK